MTVNKSNEISVADEYREKWEYIRHTEQIKEKRMQWFYIIVSAVLTLIYSKENVANISKWAPLLVIYLYSVLMCISSLIQKSNYDIYYFRVRVLDGSIKSSEVDKYKIRKKFFSSFKSRYYIIVLLSTFILSITIRELNASKILDLPLLSILAICVFNSICLAGLSFTSLIESPN